VREEIRLPVWMIVLLAIVNLVIIALLSAQVGYKTIAQTLARENAHLVGWIQNKTDYDTACRVKAWAEEKAIKEMLNE
jgi:acylphosphatase